MATSPNLDIAMLDKKFSSQNNSPTASQVNVNERLDTIDFKPIKVSIEANKARTKSILKN